MKIIFMGGIHGVGKNYLLDTIADKIQLEVLTASEVLNWNKYSNSSKEKCVKSISDTQDKLINNLNSITTDDKIYLLIGHFCLLNEHKQIERIPLTTFMKLAPISLYVKIADPKKIYDRLQIRDNKLWSIKLIEEMQQEEIKYAKELSEYLSCPLHIIEDDQSDLVLNFLNEEIK